MKHRLRAIFLVCCLGHLGIIGGCTTTPDEPQLVQWTETEAGLAKLEELIATTATDMPLRVQAFQILVRTGHSTRLRPILDQTTDDERFAAAVVDPLLAKMESGSASVDCKNAVLSLLHLLPPEQRDQAQKRIAAWAFAGLDESSSVQQVLQITEQRILPGQVEDLGIHGIGGALLLLSNNIAVPRFYEYLMSFKNADIGAKVLAGLAKMQAAPEFKLSEAHLERIASIESSDSVIMLLDLYDGTADRELGAVAFNFASSLLKKPQTTAGSEQKIIRRLERYLTGKDPDDRWFAASTSVTLGGLATLSAVMDTLPDESSYAGGIIEPQKAIVDFCDRATTSVGPDARTVLRERLTSPRRISKLMAIVCLKAIAAPDDVESLAPLVKDNTDVGDILGDELTIARMAQNAQDGITAMNVAGQKGKDRGEATDITEKRRFAILTVLHLTGADLIAEADRRFQTFTSSPTPTTIP